MKRKINFLSYLSLLLATVFLTSCGNNHSVKTIEYGAATTELIKMVKDNPNLKSMLIASLAKAREINPDRNTNSVQNLEEYYEFVSWDAENNRYAFNPSADLGWQTVETRGCVILETEEHGLVALLPIGMATIGSVNFEENVKPGVQVKKGDMLGHFAFGGSDFIMIFQDKVDFTLDAPQEDGRDSYKHLLMGERLGHLKVRNK